MYIRICIPKRLKLKFVFFAWSKSTLFHLTNFRLGGGKGTAAEIKRI